MNYVLSIYLFMRNLVFNFQAYFKTSNNFFFINIYKKKSKMLNAYKYLKKIQNSLKILYMYIIHINIC
jgi:hypothetical protein